MGAHMDQPPDQVAIRKAPFAQFTSWSSSLIAICLPIVGRSVHVPEGAEYASKSSDGLGARAPSMSDSRMLRSGIVASSRLALSFGKSKRICGLGPGFA